MGNTIKELSTFAVRQHDERRKIARHSDHADQPHHIPMVHRRHQRSFSKEIVVVNRHRTRFGRFHRNLV